MNLFQHRSDKNELLDDFSLNNETLFKNLDEMEAINHWLGSKRLLLGALTDIQDKYREEFKKNHIAICDLGCGNGDLLRSIDHWMKKKNLHAQLVGVDANPTTVRYAHEKSKSHAIQFITEDFLLPSFATYPCDIALLNSVCHHFNDETLIRLLQSLTKQARIAIVINDLQRNRFSYYAIKVIARIFHFCYLTKHDAPLSVMRAFHKQELVHLLAQANINSYELKWMWPFRWKLIIWCKRQ